MKKINFSLHLGFAGLKDSRKEIILDLLKQKSIETDYINDVDNSKVYEFFLVFNQIPIRLKAFLTEDIKEIIKNHDDIKRIDIMLLTLNLYNSSSINRYNKKDFDDFIKRYNFNGMSALVGLDVDLILHNAPSKEFRISRFNLVQKAKELNLLYCFELLNNKSDLIELYNKLLEDFTFKFQFTNPEILQKAKEYGKTLIKH